MPAKKKDQKSGKKKSAKKSAKSTRAAKDLDPEALARLEAEQVLNFFRITFKPQKKASHQPPQSRSNPQIRHFP
jgi:hypothetical protein